jgi:hypothetical protein
VTIAPALAGAMAGVAADALAARASGQKASALSAAAAAAACAICFALISAHPAPGWRGVLGPLWALGWIIAADIDLRSRQVYDAHGAALCALALGASWLDHRLLASAAGGAAAAGIPAAINLVSSRGALPSAAARAAGPASAAAVLAAAWGRIPLPAAAGLAAAAGAAAALLAALLRMMARGWEGEVIGWGDVWMAGSVGLWFGIRGMWAPLFWGLSAAAMGAAAQWAAAAAARGSWPWLSEASPTVPGLFVGAVLLPLLATPR